MTQVATTTTQVALNPKLLHRLESLERFQREGELTASLNHPGVVRVHEAGVAEGVPYLNCGSTSRRLWPAR